MKNTQIHRVIPVPAFNYRRFDLRPFHVARCLPAFNRLRSSLIALFNLPSACLLHLRASIISRLLSTSVSRSLYNLKQAATVLSKTLLVMIFSTLIPVSTSGFAMASDVTSTPSDAMETTTTKAITAAKVNDKTTSKIIAVVAPMQHQAMDDIINGLKDDVSRSENASDNEKSGTKANDQSSQSSGRQVGKALYRVEVFNAMGNSNMMHSIMLQLAKNDKYSIVAPIGKTATQLALSTVKNKPIVGLAVNMTEEERGKHHNFTFINDEVCIGHSLALVNALGYKAITVVYSNDDRIFEEIKRSRTIAKKKGIETIQEIAINNATEMYSLAKNISDKSEAIVILKDHLIVSNIKALTDISHKKGIPVIAADEGSVISGADIALGVKESVIGSKGGEVAINILNGENIANIPGKDLTDSLILFYNKKSKVITENKAKDTANSMKYKLEIL